MNYVCPQKLAKQYTHAETFVTVQFKQILFDQTQIFLFQNFIPLKEMRLARSACFPSCTKTGGLGSALRSTPQ